MSKDSNNDPFVAVCTPVYDMYQPAMIRSLRFLDFPGGQGMILETPGKPLDVARQEMTAQALTVPEVTHILWVDADMVFPQDALKQLLAHKLPIVGALCFERREPYNSTIHVGGKLQSDYPRNQLMKVDSTGGAFLLTERRVYDAISVKFQPRGWWWPMTVDTLDNRIAGDESFLIRAKECGFDVYVDTACKTGHIAKACVDEAFVDRWRKGAPNV